MAIVGSDFHGNVSKVQRFLSYKPEEEHIFAGDILDSFTEKPQDQIDCLVTLLESNCKLIWGNHELHYTKAKPFGLCSGFQYNMASDFQSILENNSDRFCNAVAVDGYLVTHAGAIDSLCKYKDVKKIAKYLNKNPEGIYDIGIARGGYSYSGGIFWFDHLREYGLCVKVNQVFGHTASEYPVETNNGIIHYVCINTSDISNRLWVFDTKIKKLQELI